MSDEFTLRPLRSCDLPGLIALHATLLPVSYPTSFFLNVVIQPTRACFIANAGDGNDPVAFCCAAIHDSTLAEPSIEILTLGVLPAFRQRRLATRLVRAVIETLSRRTAAAATAIYAHIATANKPARNFYERMGMHVCSDVIRNIYRIPRGSRDAYRVSGESRARSGQYPDRIWCAGMNH
ncbi:acyl-CoA N-acyltransferase [Mycena rebaudengoi]|nr:acyl-CoA N-acyltransferase [Mycena rebaudengoi]